MTIETTGELAGKRIAILATNGFEQAELLVPQQTLEDAGATVDIIAPEPGMIQGMEHETKGQMVAVDLTLEEANAEDYDVLVLPGGVANPDALRQVKEAIDFIEYFNETGRLVAAICHGPWSLIEADMVRGRTVTSWPSLKTDLRNAGAAWVDQEVVVDGNLITSRQPDDLAAFCAAIIDAVSNSELAEEAA
jgi:protease I